MDVPHEATASVTSAAASTSNSPSQFPPWAEWKRNRSSTADLVCACPNATRNSVSAADAGPWPGRMTRGARTATFAALVAIVTSCAGPQVAAAPSRKDAKPARAEIQVGLCSPADAIERAFPLRPREAPYETWLFDDAALSLLAQGVRVRLRVKSDGSELTVKVGAQDCNSLAPGLVPRREGKCEFDMYADHLEGVVSLTGKLDTAATRELLARRVPLTQALNAAQVRFLTETAKVWPLPPDVRPLGPIANRVYATADKGYDVDMSQLPGGERYAEISTKVALADVDRSRRALDAYIAQAGVKVCADQVGQAPAKLRALLKRQ